MCRRLVALGATTLAVATIAGGSQMAPASAAPRRATRIAITGEAIDIRPHGGPLI